MIWGKKPDVVGSGGEEPDENGYRRMEINNNG